VGRRRKKGDTLKHLLKIMLLVVAAGMLFTFAACSSSGGDDDDDVQYRLTILTPTGGTIQVSPAGTVFDEGKVVTLTPVADPGKRFTGWSGSLTGTQNPLILTMNQDYGIGATFVVFCSLSVAPVTAGTGTFTVNNGAPESGYEPGTTLTLEAVPAAGYEFIQWQGDLTGTTNPATFTIRQDRNIKALFGSSTAPKHQLTVTITPADTGTVNLASGEYAEGTIFELVATPESGYQFVSYSCGTWSATTDIANFTMPPGAAELVVTFEDAPIQTRNFRAQRATDGTWYTLTAELLGEGTYCNVFVEQGSGVTQTQAEAVAAEFDDNIFEEITTNFGAHGDVDDDDKVTLLLLDIIDGYDPVVGSYVAGYFDPAHMADSAVNSNSNECDMIFIDIYPGDLEDDAFYTTIAHEFQHLINYSRTVMEDGREQDLWINEGLSSGAEYVYSGAISQDRVDWFNSDPLDTIAYGNNFFVWYGYWEYASSSAVLDNYATVNLFFQWLRIHARNGTAIYKQILDSKNRDYRAVTTAASSWIGSAYGSWDRLLETWYLANFCCQSSGYYGYKGEISTNPIGWTRQNSASYVIEAGEGIISALGAVFGQTGTFNPPAGSGANIQYTGFNDDGTAVDRTPSFSNQFVLVLNANTDNAAGQFEDCFIANVFTPSGDNPVARSMQARIDANKKPLPKKFPVGFHPGYAGSGETPEQRLLKNRTGLKPVTNIQGKKGY
jgi:hypothetical protein